MKKRTLLLGAGALGALGYLAYARPRMVRWGATDEEIARLMAGDELIDRPNYVTNRAITIEAPPEDVWPWIAQMGEAPRAGFYSYEWVERLMGMTVENAERVEAELQELEVGKALDRRGNMIVRALDPGRALVVGPPSGLWLDSTWAMAVYPTADDHTRLVSRVRAKVNRWSPTAPFWMAMLDPGQFVMERKFLLGVKERAEALAKREALTIAVSESVMGHEQSPS
jgi:hypothetical protein